LFVKLLVNSLSVIKILQVLQFLELHLAIVNWIIAEIM